LWQITLHFTSGNRFSPFQRRLKERFQKGSAARSALLLAGLFVLSTIVLALSEPWFPSGLFAVAAGNLLAALFLAERLIGWFLRAEVVVVIAACSALVYLYPS
jgi:hypothetical protein